ncbi:MAG TPA: GNAT family N-acetyltransferase [Dehalococcoidia bacterium]|nr:GNAT family N-acetyltransferase [Dehalococcoidia bacterium]
MTEARPSERPVVERLLQLYLYDLSEFTGADVGPEGLFPYPHLDQYWSGGASKALLLRSSGHLVGLALVRALDDPLVPHDAWEMAEFFVLRGHRRRGIGTEAAMTIFDGFRGHWQVRELARNTPAQAFWRRVIADYTAGNYTDVLVDNEQWRGAMQRFDNMETG